jgi:predicted histidine transporter YuiF (NhaC family)
LLLYLLAYLFLDLGFGELFLTKGKDKMRDNEMRRIIEEQINAIIILEQQMEDIKKQMQILQELINEMTPNN